MQNRDIIVEGGHFKPQKGGTNLETKLLEVKYMLRPKNSCLVLPIPYVLKPTYMCKVGPHQSEIPSSKYNSPTCWCLAHLPSSQGNPNILECEQLEITWDALEYPCCCLGCIVTPFLTIVISILIICSNRHLRYCSRVVSSLDTSMISVDCSKWPLQNGE